MEETAGKLPSSVESVISNDDLLTEILVRLPLLSLVLFKSVSKRWLSLIKDANVTFRRNLDPISGLFLKKYSHTGSFIYEFVPLDIRIPICRSYLLTTKKNSVDILDSCNGLLLCRTFSRKLLYVHNPSITNMFKVLPEPDNVTHYNNFSAGGLKMAFDPTKSPHYKVIYGEPFEEWIRIHTYSSETGSWSLCGHQFPVRSSNYFKRGVYWNNAIYWLNLEGKFFKLDIMNDHPVLTAFRTPLTLDRKVQYECRLFESHGCLLLVDEDDAHSSHFTIYEKGNVYSEWSVKCIVNLDDIIKPFPKTRSIQELIYCIVLGEREEDSFLVMQLDKKVVQYKFVSKILNTISDLGPDEDLVSCFQFIPSFANV